MHINQIKIKNIYSFDEADFRFDQYNVIIGPNNSGKTNLVRILKRIAENSDFQHFQLDKAIKFDNKKQSQISISLQFTDTETKYILQTLFGTTITKQQFPEQIKKIDIVIKWNNIIDFKSNPTFVSYSFDNGLTIFTTDSNYIMFDANNTYNISEKYEKIISDMNDPDSKIIKEEIIQKLKLTIGELVYPLNEFMESVLKGEPLTTYFTKDQQKLHKSMPQGLQIEGSNLTQAAVEIIDYLQLKTPNRTTVNFSHLLNKIFQKNFVSIEEIYPTYETLTKKLSELKRSDEDIYFKLQDEFAQIFDNIRIKIEENPASNTTVEKILLKENKKTFSIHDSASGHYALMYILHAILNKPNQILVIDEPEVHFHPVKIKHLSRKFLELAKENNNQIIIISHSPKFIDYTLLDSSKPHVLTVINKPDKHSIVTSTPENFRMDLKSFLFNPEMFFGKCVMLVEGPSDELAIRAISDHFDGLLDKYNVVLLYCHSVNNIYPTIKILNAFSIPFVAMVDKEYKEDEHNVIKLDGNLEDEYKKLGWVNSGKLNENAYSFMREKLKEPDGLKILKKTDIWKAFETVITKVNPKGIQLILKLSSTS